MKIEVYIVTLFFLTVLSICEVLKCDGWVESCNNTQWNRQIVVDRKYILVCVIVLYFFLLSALRADSVGRDLMNYLPRYTKLGKAGWNELFSLADRFSFEYGFAVVCKLLYYINPNPSFFLLVSSLIVAIGFYNLSRMSQLPVLTLFIIFAYGFLGSSMNIVRQFIAFSILSCGVQYVFERKIWGFLLIVGLAMMFHSSSILFLPLYFLYDWKYDRKALFIVMIGIVFLAFFGGRFMGAIISHTSFANYLNTIGIGNGSGDSTLVFLLFILVGVYVYMERVNAIDKIDNFCLWCLSIAVLLNAMALSLAIFARTMVFFTPFVSVLIPNLICKMKEKATLNHYLYVFIGICTIAFFIVYYFFVLMRGEAQGAEWYPYVSRLLT